MNSTNRNRLFIPAIMLAITLTAGALAQDRVKIANGMLEGVSDKSSGVRSFKGIPFGEPPVGDYRWKPPQPVKNWQGVRKAHKLGPPFCQRPIFRQNNFRPNGKEEDLLFLNLWASAKTRNGRVAGLGYFLGGGFLGGGGSEGRYDGESMAKKGIV